MFAEHRSMGIREDAGWYGEVLLGHQSVSNKNDISDQGQKRGRDVNVFLYYTCLEAQLFFLLYSMHLPTCML